MYDMHDIPSALCRAMIGWPDTAGLRHLSQLLNCEEMTKA